MTEAEANALQPGDLVLMLDAMAALVWCPAVVVGHRRGFVRVWCDGGYYSMFDCDLRHPTPEELLTMDWPST